MNSKLDPNYGHLTMFTPHDTKVVQARAIPYGSYDEDTLSLILALVGVTLILATVVAMLVTFSVL